MMNRIASSFIDQDTMARRKTAGLLQLRVLGLGVLQDRDVRVGVALGGEEVRGYPDSARGHDLGQKLPGPLD